MSASVASGANPLAAIGQLVLSRIREFYREPEAVFWTYGFPLLMTTALGIAFREQAVEKITVDVVESASAQPLVEALVATEKFTAKALAEDECRRRLRTGKASVVVRVKPADETGGAPTYEYWYDFKRPDSLLARNQVDDAVQRAAGRADPVPTHDEEFAEPGGRYIDFLVPGLLGMSLMGGGLWGVGFVIVDMRIRKLLKRLLATPMRKSEFMAAIMFSRLAFLIPEVMILLVFARIAFGVTNHGSYLATIGLILLGAGSFSGLGLLIASRAKTIEAVSGLMNLIMLPMWVFSGIFFSSERFPDALQPFVKVLPLTVLINALRAIMLDGLSLASQATAVLTLLTWGLVSFTLALKWFRWQ